MARNRFKFENVLEDSKVEGCLVFKGGTSYDLVVKGKGSVLFDSKGLHEALGKAHKDNSSKNFEQFVSQMCAEVSAQVYVDFNVDSEDYGEDADGNRGERRHYAGDINSMDIESLSLDFYDEDGYELEFPLNLLDHGVPAVWGPRESNVILDLCYDLAVEKLGNGEFDLD